MTIDQAIALSLLDNLSRVGLTARLAALDPELLEQASARLPLAVAVRRAAAHSGFEFLPWNAPSFPAALLATTDCPPGLWCRGDIHCLQGPLVAIVGSRAGSAVALETAVRLGADLASRGVIVVSGLARGVDSAAHEGALRSGRTVAVLGCGIDRVYPREHAGLADRIAAAGAIVTEYPPGTPALPFHFPLRNRIISGLSRAVVVIEASEKSGSLITAACALEQGREVMAVPGNVLTGRNRGGHALIRDGAKIVESADDIVMELGPALAALMRRDGVPASAAWAANGLSGTDTKTSVESLMSVIAQREPCDLDDLVAATGANAPELLPLLSGLELSGRIRRVEGGRFMRASRTC